MDKFVYREQWHTKLHTFDLTNSLQVLLVYVCSTVYIHNSETRIEIIATLYNNWVDFIWTGVPLILAGILSCKMHVAVNDCFVSLKVVYFDLLSDFSPHSSITSSGVISSMCNGVLPCINGHSEL